MQRRGFLAAMLAATAAPAIVRASSLMKIVPVKPDVLIYKASGRYDFNFDQWAQDSDSTLYTRPTQLIVPPYLANLARSMVVTKETVCSEILSRREWA